MTAPRTALQVRRADERGHANHGWLDSHHTFSFADYYDPQFMGYSVLRVINEDRVAPGAGFPTHGHRDMEIVSYVVDGALEHRDSMGNGSVLRKGDIQRMTAGTGVRHSEFNASKDAALHFLQIWILPTKGGLAPGYEERHFSDEDKRNRLRLVLAPEGASGPGTDGALRVHQDLRLYAASLDGTAPLAQSLDKTRKGWLQLVRGSVELTVEGEAPVKLAEGDGVALASAPSLRIAPQGPSELLFFDLP